MREIFDVIKMNHMAGMNKMQRFRVKVQKVYEWLKTGILYFLSRYLARIFLIIINIYSCYQFLFYTQEPEYVCTLHFTLLYWNLCSMVVSDP